MNQYIDAAKVVNYLQYALICYRHTIRMTLTLLCVHRLAKRLKGLDPDITFVAPGHTQWVKASDVLGTSPLFSVALISDWVSSVPYRG